MFAHGSMFKAILYCLLIGQVHGSSGNIEDQTAPFNNPFHYLTTSYKLPFNCFPASLFILPDVQSHGNRLNCEETSFASLIASTRTTPQDQPPLWWSLALIIPFCVIHLAAAYGVYCRPISTVPTAILVATIAVAQLATSRLMDA